jgi:hypothetical protein
MMPARPASFGASLAHRINAGEGMLSGAMAYTVTDEVPEI